MEFFGGTPDRNETALIAQLRTTLAKMELSLDSLSEAIVWSDEAGRVLWCNSSFARLVGQRHIMVLGSSIATILPLTSDGRSLAPESQPWIMAVRHQRASGVYELARADRRLVLDVEAVMFVAAPEGSSGSPPEKPAQ